VAKLALALVLVVQSVALLSVVVDNQLVVVDQVQRCSSMLVPEWFVVELAALELRWFVVELVELEPALVALVVVFALVPML
jgi:type IV secretory pathway VirB6-like protein